MNLLSTRQGVTVETIEGSQWTVIYRDDDHGHTTEVLIEATEFVVDSDLFEIRNGDDAVMILPTHRLISAIRNDARIDQDKNPADG